MTDPKVEAAKVEFLVALVRLGKDCFLSHFTMGAPRTTADRGRARRFPTRQEAENAIAKTRKDSRVTAASLVELPS